MSNTASLELSKKLYELSGWEETEKVFEILEGNAVQPRSMALAHRWDTPAYDAGYLLRKLPNKMQDEGWLLSLDHDGMDDAEEKIIWLARYYDGDTVGDETPISICPVTADTPEDALCKVAIKLFEEGVL